MNFIYLGVGFVAGFLLGAMAGRCKAADVYTESWKRLIGELSDKLEIGEELISTLTVSKQSADDGDDGDDEPGPYPAVPADGLMEPSVN